MNVWNPFARVFSAPASGYYPDRNQGELMRLTIPWLVLLSSTPAFSQPQSREELEAFLDGAIASQMRSYHVASATVSVVKDGELYFAKGYGWADREKRTSVDPEKTLFRPGSISKLFTWTSVMQLVERGKIDLDADVNTYLKDFKIPDTFPGKPVTMKHLLTHTPGFEDGALGYLLIKDEHQLVPLSASLAAHVPWRVRPPWTYSSYSNYGAALAGLIVANVSGMPFEEYVEKNIFEPLGMSHSTFREPLPKALVQGVEALVHAPRRLLFQDSALAQSAELQVGDHEPGHVGRGRGERSRGAEVADELEVPRLEGAVLAPVGRRHVGRERRRQRLAKRAPRHAQRLEDVLLHVLLERHSRDVRDDEACE
ncbi:MAG TPA: serine hydrolase domain-containing protein, partial [Vicinamibacteria bacterium]